MNILDSVYVLNTNLQEFTHTGLAPTDTICYYVTTVGSYCNGSTDSILFNDSQIACATPQDEQPPCPPDFNITSDCETDAPHTNFLTFTPIDNPPLCINDVISYTIWFAPYEGDSLIPLDNASDTLYDHLRDSTRAGCYYVTAADASGNVSAPSDTICIDNCPLYILPNIFTPNGDTDNELFIPILPTRYVKSVRFRIYNRWGRKIFETSDQRINWPGKDEKGNLVPDGMYYYVADVRFYRLRREDEYQELKGWFKLAR